MNIEDILESLKDYPLERLLADVTDSDVERVLAKDRVVIDDFPVLLSDNSQKYLEHFARKSEALTRKHFGNVILLFTPMYIANFCENTCPYCSFSKGKRIARKQLSFDEIKEDSAQIAKSGIRHILVLTGESREHTTYDYLEKSIRIISEQFSSVGIEVYPMEENDYAGLINSGVDSLTIYQETYDKKRYEYLHKGGPKQDYLFRLHAPDRACRRGIRSVTVGALLGLHDFKRELFAVANHVQYLQDTYPDVEVSLSFPRIRPLAGNFQPTSPVSERWLVQIITAFRIMFPHIGIVVSTRESEYFRNGVLPIGPTKMSAGVSTAVGGHSEDPSTTQFEISDSRDVKQMQQDLLKMGFQTVMHDWNQKMIKSV